MKKVAVFGKPGGGKCTLSKKLASAAGIKLHALDSILYKPNGETVDRRSYDEAHENILASENWLIDGIGPLQSFNRRLAAADTLIYIDLPYWVSHWMVTKRLLKGLFVTPTGWPEGSSVIKGTIASYRVLKRCPQFWNDSFVQNLEQVALDKSLYVIRSVSELDRFIEQMCNKRG